MPKSLGSNYFLVSHHSHTTLTTDDYTTVDRTPFDQYILKLTHLQDFGLFYNAHFLFLIETRIRKKLRTIKIMLFHILCSKVT